MCALSDHAYTHPSRSLSAFRFCETPLQLVVLFIIELAIELLRISIFRVLNQPQAVCVCRP